MKCALCHSLGMLLVSQTLSNHVDFKRILKDESSSFGKHVALVRQVCGSLAGGTCRNDRYPLLQSLDHP